MDSGVGLSQIKAGEPGEGTVAMESDLRYYARRISMERLAAARALTSEARERRLQLVQSYQAKVAALVG